MKILILASAYNGLSQRIHQELLLQKHCISFELSSCEQTMFASYTHFNPDLIICPFLKHRIPESIWSSTPCLVLHPGIVGDQGPSSLDWAITNQENIWGATLLQANAVFDGGEVWGTEYFDLEPHKSKASIYRHQISKCATTLIINAVNAFKTSQIKSVNRDELPLTGTLRPLMKQTVRQIDWRNDTTDDIVRKIHAADSFPGVLDQIGDDEYYLFGAIKETLTHNAAPGEILGTNNEAICRATIDGAVWIRQLKKKVAKGSRSFKLPASRALPNKLTTLDSKQPQDVYFSIEDNVGYLHFNFYNGAFSTENCIQLKQAFLQLTNNNKVKVIALMGGDDFFSNGIHLNCIESAECPAHESWRNINAINDVIQNIIECSNKLTVAALKCNAGAGGAILPIACDYVIARDGIVLNPHYQTMGLTGSEYWTYLLPKRVGQVKAKALTNNCMPILAREAETINLVDTVFSENMNDYHRELRQYCQSLATSIDYDNLLETKNRLRKEDEKMKPLSQYREEELNEMKRIFNDVDSPYHKLRYNFVNKISCNKTPERLINHQFDQLSITD